MKTKLISNLLEKKIKVSFLGCCVVSVLCMPLHTNATQGIVSPDGYTDFSNNSVKDVEDDFVLNSKSWLNIQLYVKNSLELPITENAMRESFGIPIQVDFPRFQDLLGTYQDLHNTADSWNRTVYPDIISHAHDLKNYALLRDQFLEPITLSLAKLAQTQSEEDRVKALAFLTALQTYTKDNRDKASKSLQQLNGFYADLQKHIGALSSMEKKYSELSLLNTDDLEAKLEELHDDVVLFNEIYTEKMYDAEKTLFYAWIPIVGWIYGPYMAGIHAEKATAVQKHIRLIEHDINGTEREIRHRKKLFLSYKQAYLSLTKVRKDTEAARDDFARIALAWTNLHADLEHAVTLLNSTVGEDGIQHVLLAQFQFEQTRGIWRNISNKASKFANYAYAIN